MRVLRWPCLAVLCAVSVAGAEQSAEFVDPLKNISTAVGSNAYFSCQIRNLGDSRIMWFRKRGDGPQEILAVNGLMLTRSPKMSVSVRPSSGLVMESILYIYDLDDEEAGAYSCAVNTNPMILQKGTLEIFSKYEKPVQNTVQTTVGPPRTRKGRDGEAELGSDSTLFCFDFPKIWRETKREASGFASEIWKKVTALFK